MVKRNRYKPIGREPGKTLGFEGEREGRLSRQAKDQEK